MSGKDLSQVNETKDVVIGDAGGRDLLADVFRPPAGKEKRTGLLHFHGGGFRGGSKEGARLARHLAALGYVSVACQYRLTNEAKWPAQIEDVKTAIRWVRANAPDLDVDPAKTSLVGYSAGGQLSLIAAGTQNVAGFEGDGGNAGAGTEIAACVALYPPTTMERLADGGLPEPMAPGSNDEDLRKASPLSYVAPGFPPTLLLHGTPDTTVSFENSLDMFHALRKVETPVELHAFPGLFHAFDGNPELAELVAPIIDFFLDRYVVNPREFAPAARVGAGRPA